MARSPLRPIYVVSKKEFRTNLISIRMAILLSILALVVVGGSYGFAGLSTVPSSREQFVLFVHPTVSEDRMGIVVFASDAWGVAHRDLEIELYRNDPLTGGNVLAGTTRTDSDGFGRFPDLPEGSYDVQAALGVISFSYGVTLLPEIEYSNLTYQTEEFDLDGSGLQDDLVIHMMDIGGGLAQGAIVYLEGEQTDLPDSRGYLSVKLREGLNNVTLAYGEETHNLIIFTSPGPGPVDPFAQGPDFVLFLIAFSFGTLLLPIVAIALSYDSISKEKVQGSADLLLYRPASWRSIALGKFLGVFAAIAVPVTAVNLTGVLIIALVTGTWPSSTVTLGFVAFSLFLLAAYILLMQSFSTLAKTAGTAILFGVVVWFAFNLLWSVILALISIALGFPIGSREYYVFASYLGLVNPSSIYQYLFILVAPEGFQLLGLLAGAGTLFALPNWVPPVAAAIWLALLFILFVEVYNKKAAL